jgi:hypothetical protein
MQDLASTSMYACAGAIAPSAEDEERLDTVGKPGSVLGEVDFEILVDFARVDSGTDYDPFKR